MKLIFFICSIWFLFPSKAQNPSNGQCELEGVTSGQWNEYYVNDPVDDNITTLFKEFKAIDILDASLDTNQDHHKYFTVTLSPDKTLLTIAPSDQFKNFETEIPSQRDFVFVIRIEFQCQNKDSRALGFRQPINDLNTFEPIFEKPEYIYDLPLPLQIGFEITIFGDEIIASDYDISNTRVIFEIEPADKLEITSMGPIDGTNKHHKASIKTTEVLRLDESAHYTIKVTDTGEPTKSTTANLILKVDEQTQLPPNPIFERAYYTGEYQISGASHSINIKDSLQLEKGCKDVSLRLLDNNDNFNVVCKNDEVIVELIKNLDDAVLEENVVVLVTIEATLEKAEKPGRTVLVVYLPKQECPGTTTPAATTACPTPTPIVTTECPEVTCPSCPISTTGTTPTACPECPVTECPLTCPTTVSPSTIASCPECPVTCPTTSSLGTTAQCPECPSTSHTTLSSGATSTACPVTECPLTCPTITSPNTITPCPECPTTCPTTLSPATITPCPECPVTSPTTVSSGTTSSTTLSSSTTTGTTTKCPECPECPSTTEACPLTCPPPNPTTTCPTSPTTPEPPAISFPKDSYAFYMASTYTGFVGYVTAKANFEETILHTLDSALPFLKYDEQSGKLEKIDYAPIHAYKTTAYAIGQQSKLTATVLVEFIMNDNENLLEVKDSIITGHINEDEVKTINMPCDDNQKCVYQFEGSFPKVDKDFFMYDPNTNVLSIAKIDREMDEIVNMLVPQFVLEFTLTEVGYKNNFIIGNNNSHPRLQKEDKREWVILPQVVPQSADKLILTFIIDDINDNPPVFVQGKKLTVGYPGKEFVQQMAPPYLTQVTATDRDVGFNAEIRYSTDSENFEIHPKTGVIYPRGDSIDDDLKFIVTATDQDGEGHSTDLEIEVKLLKKDNLIVLTIESILLEDVQDTLKEISSQTDMDMRYLTAAVLPSLETEKSDLRLTSFTFIKYFRNLVNFDDDDKDYSTTLILYGLDKDDKPLKNNELEKALDNSEMSVSISSEDWKQCVLYDGDDEGSAEICGDYVDHNHAGYIAAISVLACLLVIFIIAAAAFYYFKIYKKRQPKPYTTMVEDEDRDSNSITYEKNPRASSLSKSEEISQRRPTGFVFTPPPIEDLEQNIYEDALSKSEQTATRRPTGFIFNSPPVEEDDDIFGERETPKYEEPSYVQNNRLLSPRSPNSYADPVDVIDSGSGSNYVEMKKDNGSPSSDSDRPKSVKFKETVEKINIIVDDQEKHNDDVLDERL